MFKCLIEIKDLKTGKSSFQPMHSFVSNFLGLLTFSFGFTPEFNVKTRGGTNYGKTYIKYIVASNHDLTYGLLVGLGDTPASCDDLDLDSHATLDCGSVSVTNPNEVEGLEVITIARSFVNEGEADVIVKELGLFSYSGHEDDPYMLTRDVLDSPVTFAPGDGKMFKLHVGFTANFTDWFLMFLEYRFIDISDEIKCIDGEYQTTNFTTCKLLAGAGVKHWGIVIGDGTTAPTISDYCLESRHVTNWDYSEVYMDSCVQDTENNLTKLRLFRQFTNNTGSAQTISEIGIICSFGDNSNQKTLLARYVIDPIEIADGQSANVYWNFSTPVACYEPPEEPEEPEDPET